MTIRQLTWDKPAMRVLVVCFVLVSALGCGSGSYGDAGVDAPFVPAQNFDVDTNAPDGGPYPICPGGLYGVQSQSYGNATCTHAPERCVNDNNAPNAIECNCAPTGDDGMGVWTCQQL